MIQFRRSIRSIAEYQTGILPANAEKLKTPESTDAMMKKTVPLMIAACLLLNLILFFRIFAARRLVLSPLMILPGFLAGLALLPVHELLHAAVYPRAATVTVGRLRGRMILTALASYPMKRGRFILMCLLPFLLGIIPLLWFLLSPADAENRNGLLFGAACVGIVSPVPDVYNVMTVLRQADRHDSILFYGEDLWKC